MTPYLQLLRNYYSIVFEEGDDMANDWLKTKLKLNLKELLTRVAMEINHSDERQGRIL